MCTSRKRPRKLLVSEPTLKSGKDGMMNNTAHRCCVIELCTWNLYSFVHQCHPNKFNLRKWKEMKSPFKNYLWVLLLLQVTECLNHKSPHSSTRNLEPCLTMVLLTRQRVRRRSYFKLTPSLWPPTVKHANTGRHARAREPRGPRQPQKLSQIILAICCVIVTF